MLKMKSLRKIMGSSYLYLFYIFSYHKPNQTRESSACVYKDNNVIYFTDGIIELFICVADKQNARRHTNLRKNMDLILNANRKTYLFLEFLCKLFFWIKYE